MEPKLTPRLKRILRHCFVKIDDSTIEIKEKRGVIGKLMALFITFTFGYYQFFHPDYRQTTFDDLRFTFQPETRFQDSWIFKEAPNITELPSFRTANDFDLPGQQFKITLIISTEENRKKGFDKVPCPHLFEYPKEQSLHFSKIFGMWGNIQDESNTPLDILEKQRSKKKQKKENNKNPPS